MVRWAGAGDDLQASPNYDPEEQPPNNVDVFSDHVALRILQALVEGGDVILVPKAMAPLGEGGVGGEPGAAAAPADDDGGDS